MLLTTNEIAAATNGRVLGEAATVDGASIDSRQIRSGQLFVPVIDARDGHDFIGAALEGGAGAYLTSREDTTGRSAVQVADTSAALLDLGRLARSHLPDRVIAITGSVGKTSTKDLLSAVLTTTWVTTANQASFNNELGVPLTLLDAGDGAEAVICEMGARGPGHIALLCGIAHPTVGVVTAVEGAHFEKFGSLEGVAHAKGELIEALPSDGVAVLNSDQPLVAAMSSRTQARVVHFGFDGSAADVTAVDIEIDGDLRPSFTMVSPWGSINVRLAARGRHQVSNALAAAATGLVLGVPIDDVATGLEAGVLSPLRMELVHRGDGLAILNDSYNANPASTEAALKAISELDVLRRIAVLGFMAELGSDEIPGHLRVANTAAALGVEVIGVGTDRYGPGVRVVDGLESAQRALAEMGLGRGDVVLVKGSRVAGMERVASWLVRQA